MFLIKSKKEIEKNIDKMKTSLVLTGKDSTVFRKKLKTVEEDIINLDDIKTGYFDLFNKMYEGVE